MYCDEIIWKGIIEGDKEMLLALYRKYYHNLLFIGLKQVKDPHLVKDVIQQQFLYLWEKRTHLQMAENARAYLTTSFLRRLRADSKKIKRNIDLRSEDISQFIDKPISPEENMIAKDGQRYLHQILMNRIDSLPPREKELIILKFYQGLTYDEIVEKTGISHRTVYNKMHEALKNLKLNMDIEKSSFRSLYRHILIFFLWVLLNLLLNG